MMDQPVSRRAWISAIFSGAGALALSACDGSLRVSEIDTPEGRVFQWEGNDLLVLVSGIATRYRPGEAITFTVLANNQSTNTAQLRVRTKLLGRGDQAIVEDPVTVLTVKPEDAATLQRTLPLPRGLAPGEYTVAVEVPPWTVGGRETGSGATIRARVQVGGEG